MGSDSKDCVRVVNLANVSATMRWKLGPSAIIRVRKRVKVKWLRRRGTTLCHRLYDAFAGLPNLLMFSLFAQVVVI